MTWTSDPPKVPGWYWVRDKSLIWWKEPRQFFQHSDGHVFACQVLWSNMADCEFSGPLPEPEEPPQPHKT